MKITDPTFTISAGVLVLVLGLSGINKPRAAQTMPATPGRDIAQRLPYLPDENGDHFHFMAVTDVEETFKVQQRFRKGVGNDK